MLASLMTVIYAWSRIVLYPTALVWLVALTTAPALGWPAVARWRVWAAWSVLLFIPVWGAVRLGCGCGWWRGGRRRHRSQVGRAGGGEWH